MAALNPATISFLSDLHHTPRLVNEEEAGDIDFITHDLFHQPTLTENDIAERLVIEPFAEGATYAD